MDLISYGISVHWPKLQFEHFTIWIAKLVNKSIVCDTISPILIGSICKLFGFKKKQFFFIFFYQNHAMVFIVTLKLKPMGSMGEKIDRHKGFKVRNR